MGFEQNTIKYLFKFGFTDVPQISMLIFNFIYIT